MTQMFPGEAHPSSFIPQPFLTGPACSRSSPLTFGPWQPLSLLETLYFLPEIVLPHPHSDLSGNVASSKSLWVCAKRYAWMRALPPSHYPGDSDPRNKHGWVSQEPNLTLAPPVTDKTLGNLVSFLFLRFPFCESKSEHSPISVRKDYSCK